MTEIRAHDEALATIDRALMQWAAETGGALAQAMTAAAGAHAAAEAETSRRAQQVAALEALLSALPPDDPERAQVQRDLARAQVSLDAARRAAQRIADVTRQVARLQHAHVRTAETNVTTARADLSRRATALDRYRAVRVEAAAGAAVTGILGGLGTAALAAVNASPVPSTTSSSSWLGQAGLADIDVAAADFGDNPISGSFGRGGLTRADYRWALTTWDQVVRPGLERGMSRSDFACRDETRGAPPLRRTTDVYDMFLGSDPLHLERRADGTLNVINGRHRIEVARELGITHLPAAVTGP